VLLLGAIAAMGIRVPRQNRSRERVG